MALRSAFHGVTSASLALLTGSCAAPPALPVANGDFAIVDVAVVPMDTERVDEHRTVVVARGHITAVAPADAIRLAPGIVQVDGRGRFLIPGLADMHVHVWSDLDLPLYVANGVTLIRNMWGNAETLDRRRRIAEGKLLGPRMLTAGPLADGDPPVWSQALVVRDAAEACAQMAKQQREGFDFFKIYDKISPAAFDGIVACSRSTGYPFAGHVPDAISMERMILGGARSIEHLTGYDVAERRTGGPYRPRSDYPNSSARVADRTVIAEKVAQGQLAWPDVFDPGRRDTLAALAAREQVWSVPTLTVAQRINLPRPRVFEELRRPEMRYVDPLTKASWNPDNDFRRKSSGDRELTLLSSYFSQTLERVRALNRAGAPLLVGTDAPNPLIVHGFAEHDELALLVSAGLTPYQALSAATTAPARFLGEQGRSGVVAPGARADLVLLEANPLVDISATRRIDGVALAGRWLSRQELQEMLAQTEARFAIPDDWFAHVAPPPGLHANALLMKSHTAGVNTGAERYALALEGGGWRLLAQQSGRDGDDYVATVAATADADGPLLSLDFRREGNHAVTRARLRREGEAVVLEGTGADGAAITARAPVAPYIGCDLAACIAPLLPALRALAPGAQREVPVLALDVFPQLALAPERWLLQRDTDPKIGAARITVTRGQAKRGVRVRWDDRGLVAVVVDGDLGDVETLRVETR